MHDTKKISIIIVNYNLDISIIELINSIDKFKILAVAEVIVVDNSDLPSSLLLHDERISYIFNGGNVGFGRACNIGVNKSKYDKLLFINPDIILTSPRILEVIDKVEDGTSVGITLLDEMGVPTVSYGNFPSLRYYFFRAFKLDRIFPMLKYRFHIGIAPQFIPIKTKEVDYVSGAFFGITKKDFLSVGGFDSDYFLYYEEADLFYRLKKNNVNCMVLPYINAIHIGSASTGEGSAFKKNEMQKSLRLYFNKRGRPMVAEIVCFLSRLSD